MLEHAVSNQNDPQDFDQIKGFLASLIYLRGEANKDHLPETRAILERAFVAFFNDLEQNGKLTDDLILVRQFFLKAMSLKEKDYNIVLRLLSFIDDTEEDHMNS